MMIEASRLLKSTDFPYMVRSGESVVFQSDLSNSWSVHFVPMEIVDCMVWDHPYAVIAADDLDVEGYTWSEFCDIFEIASYDICGDGLLINSVWVLPSYIKVKVR